MVGVQVLKGLKLVCAESEIYVEAADMVPTYRISLLDCATTLVERVERIDDLKSSSSLRDGPMCI